MSRRASPAAVGGFVLGGIAILVAGILALGGGRLFARTQRFVVFFEGSVNGLSAGSAVKVAGVPVGQVLEIDAIVDATQWTVLTKALIEIDPDRLERRGVSDGASFPVDELIDNGLRARLEIESLLTGLLYVDLSFRSDTAANLIGGSAYPEIPSLPTTVQEIEAQVRKVFAKLSDMPLDEIMKSLNSTLAGVDRVVNDPAIPRALASLDTTLAEARAAMQSVQDLAQRTGREVSPVSEAATQTLDETRRAVEDVRRTLGTGSPLSYQLTVTLQELDRTLQALRTAAQEIERNPRSLVFGRRER
jgi:paraquat-inducible protein B